MAIAAFDVGGTSVKYGLWKGEEISAKGSFPTPATWEEMKTELKKVFQQFSAQEKIDGVGFSFPGAVDVERGVIEGISAVPYIHHFPIQAELEKEWHVPVKMENDANCAALAEVWRGAASQVQHALFVVVGTGIGGAVIVNRELVKGMNLFGGEFGCMLLDGENILSMLGSPYQAARRYSSQAGEEVDGRELFRRADNGDMLAQQEVDIFQNALAQGIHNLLVCFNPELLIIGGAISEREELLDQLTWKVEHLLRISRATDVEVRIVPCQFRNDANLIGAVAAFEKEERTEGI